MDPSLELRAAIPHLVARQGDALHPIAGVEVQVGLKSGGQTIGRFVTDEAGRLRCVEKDKAQDPFLDLRERLGSGNDGLASLWKETDGGSGGDPGGGELLGDESFLALLSAPAERRQAPSALRLLGGEEYSLTVGGAPPLTCALEPAVVRGKQAHTFQVTGLNRLRLAVELEFPTADIERVELVAEPFQGGAQVRASVESGARLIPGGGGDGLGFGYLEADLTGLIPGQTYEVFANYKLKATEGQEALEIQWPVWCGVAGLESAGGN